MATAQKFDLSVPADKTRALQELAAVIPVVPFKGVDSFFDIGGLLAAPAQLQLCFDILEHELAPFLADVDAIGCFDARGFLFAPYLGARFQKRVFMLRKPGKMPSVSDTIEYFKEYQGDNVTGGDYLSIQRHAVCPGDRVLLIDDLLATGGTAEAGIRLVQQAGGKIVACVFVVEIAVLEGRARALRASDRDANTRVISLLSEKDFKTTTEE